MKRMMVLMLGLSMPVVGWALDAPYEVQGPTVQWEPANGETWSSSRTIQAKNACGPMDFTNMTPGKQYALLLRNPRSGTCSFTYEGAPRVHFDDGLNLNEAEGSAVILNFTRVGDDVFGKRIAY